jgi:hypothetical protein
MAFNGTGSNVTSLNVSNASLGTLAVARGGTGTASPSLVGGTNVTISGSWPNQTVTASSGAPSTAQVLSATAGASAGAVGTYMFGYANAGGNTPFGDTRAGSGLNPTSAATQNPIGGSTWGFSAGAAQSGTWRAMGKYQADSDQFNAGVAGSTLWLRIS